MEVLQSIWRSGWEKTYTFDHDSRPIEKNIYREIYLYICAAINTEKGESDVSASNP